eukprot:12394769-Alexandrium_andersonii.AAC.1
MPTLVLCARSTSYFACDLPGHRGPLAALPGPRDNRPVGFPYGQGGPSKVASLPPPGGGGGAGGR